MSLQPVLPFFYNDVLWKNAELLKFEQSSNNENTHTNHSLKYFQEDFLKNSYKKKHLTISKFKSKKNSSKYNFSNLIKIFYSFLRAVPTNAANKTAEHKSLSEYQSRIVTTLYDYSMNKNVPVPANNAGLWIGLL